MRALLAPALFVASVALAQQAAAQRSALPPEPPSGIAAALRDAFAAHLHARGDALRACHAEAGARRGAPLVTHLVLVVRVSPDGAAAVRIVARRRIDRPFERCVLGALGAPRLSPHAHGAARSILYDRLFESGGPLLPPEPAPAPAG